MILKSRLSVLAPSCCPASGTRQVSRKVDVHVMPVTCVYVLPGGDVASCGYDNMCAISRFANTSASSLASLLGINLKIELSETGVG